MARISGFEELSDKLEELADKFDTRAGSQTPRDPETGQFRSKAGRFDPKNRIMSGVHNAVEDHVVPQARTDAAKHVPPEDARTIKHESRGWSGDRYRHSFYSTSDLVKYHEFGTSTKAQDRSRATIDTFPNGETGYRIPAPPKQYAAIPASEWNGPDWMIYTDGDGQDAVIFDYVVHPGVSNKRFMQRALEQNIWAIREYVADELDDIDIDI